MRPLSTIFALLATALLAPSAFAIAEADLLVGYDQTYASANGGTAQTRVIIANAVAGSNAINERSGTPERVRIVGYHQAAQYSYMRTSNGGFVSWMSSYDSRLADVTIAGDNRGADLVTFICESTADGAGAVAGQPGRYSSFDPSAFWSTVVAHELGGHNYGCDHRDGHANPKTVMLHNYCGGGAQGWFSNPNIWLNNTRLTGGDSCLGAGIAGGDNAGVICGSAQGVADRNARISVAPNLGNVVRHWSFNQTAGSAPGGTTITDSVSGTALATVQGNGATFTGDGLQIPGGTSGSGAAYVQLPAGVVSGYTDVTIEIWATPLSAKSWGRIMDFNNGTANYLSLMSSRGTDLGLQRFEDRVSGTTVTRDSGIPTVAGVPHHYAVTFDDNGSGGGRWTWFRDGDEVAYLDVAHTLSALQDVNNWLGRSAYGADELAHCEYAEVRISNVAMTRDEVLANYTLGANRQAAGVTLAAADALGSSSFNAAGNWSDGLAPGVGKSYETYNFRLRTPADATSRTFAGQSLTLTGGSLTWKGTGSNNITVNDLRLAGSSEVLHAGSGTFTLAGNLTVKDDGIAVRSASGPINLTANLSGSSTLEFLENTTTLGGSNSAFTGRISVGDGRSSAIAIDSEARLGPNPASFVSDQLRFNRGTLRTSGTFAIDDPNRGILFDVNGGTFDVTSGTLTLSSPLRSPDNGGNPTVGLLRKTGAGTLVIASTDSTYNGMLQLGSGGQGNDGVVKVVNSVALAGIRSPIFITNNNAGSSTLALEGGVTLNKWVDLSGRNNSVPAIQNLSGNNTMQGLLLEAGGSDYRIQSDSGLLTMTTALQSGVTGTRTLTFQGSGDITVSSAIQNGSADQINVVKNGAGTLTLGGASTHSGDTTLSQGILRLTGSLTTTGTMTTAAGTIFAGTGSSNAATTINGTHQPGNATNSTGTQTFTGALAYAANSRLAWTLVGNTTNSSSTNKVAAQAVTVTGGGSGAKINLVFNGLGSGVDFNNAFWVTSRSWTVLAATTMTGQFALGTVSNDSLGNPVTGIGSFSLQQSATGVTLNFFPAASAPPAAPTGLALLGQPGAVSLNWSTTPTATSYNVRRSNVSGGPYDIVASGITGTSFTDATVSDGTPYFYVVTAVNAFGEGDESAESTATPHQPTTFDKADNTTNLNLSGSWAAGVVPSGFDTARWTGLAGANTTVLGGNMTLGGIRIESTGGAVTIGAGNTLTLGNDGIDMSTANQNLSIASGLTLGAGDQTWTVGTGRTLATTGTFTRGTAATLVVDKTVHNGTATASGISNVNSIAGPWAAVRSTGIAAAGSANGFTYATKNGSNQLVTFQAATSANWGWTSSNNDTFNYDVTGPGGGGNQLGVARTANTARYVGGTVTQYWGNNNTTTITLNGLMNAGTGTLTFAQNGPGNTASSFGRLVVGATGELVLTAASADITVNMPVIDGTAAGSLTTSGPHTVTFGAANTFTGALNVNSGTTVADPGNGANDRAFSYVSGITVHSGATLRSGANGLFGWDGTQEKPVTVHRGGTLVANGELLSDVGVGLLTLNGGTLATLASNSTDWGSWRFDNSTDKLLVTADSTVSATRVKFGNASAAIEVQTGRTLNFTGTVDNTANGGNSYLRKTGGGTLILAGANTYTNATSLEAGTTFVNGSLGNTAVTVATGATLAGNGTLAGATTINGTHAPGASAGSQSLGSTLGYGAASKLEWELAANSVSPESADKVVASGAVTITSGATLDVSFTPTGSGVAFNDVFWKEDRSWTVLTGPSVTGSFTLGNVGNDPAGRILTDYGTLSLEQNTTSVTLVFTPSLTPIEIWRQANFGTDWNNPLISGDLVDVEPDGNSNLVEYATGTNPNLANGHPLQGETSGGKLKISFTRYTEATDVILIVTASDGLDGGWTEIARSENGAAFAITEPEAQVSETGAGTLRNVEVTDVVTTTDPAHRKRFMRLEVVR
ncbi:MAG: autotransporter-associated beta strand repeat-containing protein [Akkermansiaceae bacterium]|nr:autotransporter-associated beta strand repeat-containing protein [Akkermansiaceae bacterium]